MYTFINTKFSALLIISALFLFASCSNPTSNDDDDDHSDPFGVALILNGVEIAVQENGEITYNDGDHIELEVGEETNLITLRWIDEDGDRFVPDTDDGFALQWIIEHEEHLEIEQHEEDGAWSFHFVGLAEGETDVNFELWHNDHADFTSQAFEVHVEQGVASMEVRDDGGNNLVTVDESGTVNGSLDLSNGETAGPFTAVFLNDEGEVIDTDNDYELEWHVESGSDLVNIERSSENPFSFSVTALEQGQAEMHFELIKEHGGHDDDDHGDDDHGDEIVAYESPDILINVN